MDKSSHVTWQTLKCYDFLVYCFTTLLVFDQPKFQEFFLFALQSRNVGVKSVDTKVNITQLIDLGNIPFHKENEWACDGNSHLEKN